MGNMKAYLYIFSDKIRLEVHFDLDNFDRALAKQYRAARWNYSNNGVYYKQYVYSTDFVKSVKMNMHYLAENKVPLKKVDCR